MFHPPAPPEWTGNYPSWEAARAKCSGYDTAAILEKVKQATLKVKKGEAAYERDSVNFDEVQYSALLTGALKTILEEQHGRLRMVDFGGSLGSSYYQNRQLLATAKELSWNVVEQKHFVDCGRAHIAEGPLKFSYTIEEALEGQQPQALLLASVIQYMEKPYELLDKCLGLGFEYILVDRTAFIEGSKERITVQQVPAYIYEASYPAWFLDEAKFLKVFAGRYDLVDHRYSEASPGMPLEDKKKAYWKGFFFKRKA